MTREQSISHALDGALASIPSAVKDPSVRASIAKHLDVRSEPCASCGTLQQRVVVVDANGNPRTRIGGSGVRPMELAELVVELRASDGTW